MDHGGVLHVSIYRSGCIAAESISDHVAVQTRVIFQILPRSDALPVIEAQAG